MTRRRRPRLLLIDDGDRHVELLHTFLRGYDYVTRCELPGPCWTCARRPGCTLTHAHDLREAEAALAARAVDAVLLDVSFELPIDRLAPSPTQELDVDRRRRLQGLDILTALRRDRPLLPVVLLTAREELALEDAVELVDGDENVTLAGPDAFDARVLGLLIERVVSGVGRSEPDGDYLWGRTPKMARLRRDAVALARTSLPMLLLGETGTGKSALAERVIHPASARTGRFVAADLASIPPTLIAAELFGASRGAYSGAIDRPGLLEAAQGGTLFLDEIGNLPPEAQRLLLLALERQQVTRLGESTPRKTDFKLVAATNADLPALIEQGAFRADLHARLNPSAQLTLPPLRSRVEDLPELVSFIVRRTFAGGADRALLDEYARTCGLPRGLRAEVAFEPRPGDGKTITFVLSSATATSLRAHAWAGNLRELWLLVSSAAVLALADALTAAQQGPIGASSTASVIPIPNQLLRTLLRGAPARTAAGATVTLSTRPGKTLHAVARDLERQLYEQLHRLTDGDFAAMASRLLGQGGPVAARKVRLRYNQLGLRVRGK